MFKYLLGFIPFIGYSATLPGSFFDHELPGIKFDKPPKAILLVNTASKCGMAAQLKELEAVYQEYKERGLVVVGVPSSDFMSQEPLEDKDIASVCKLRYGVTFPLMKKSHVAGMEAISLYQWLSSYNRPRWNYHKYLFDAQGQLVTDFWPTTSVLSSKVINKIEETLSRYDG